MAPYNYRGESIFDCAVTKEIKTPFVAPTVTNAAPKAPGVGKRVYYVLKRKWEFRYLGKDGLCNPTLAGAEHHPTVAAAALKLTPELDINYNDWQIVRVEETTVPGGLREVPLGSKEQTGVVVKNYNGREFWDGTENPRWTYDIAKARMFASVSDAAHELQAAAAQRKYLIVSKPTFVGVARTEPTVTTTETVLA